MNKREFLEILKDYLSKHFSENEVNDILRDYEEYFVDGEIEGKSDIEIISSLGSPKSIVRDLVGEMKEAKQAETNRKLDKVHDGYNKAKIKAKEQFYKGKEFVNEKLTPSLSGEENGFSTKFIKLLLTILSFVLFIPAAIYVVGMFSVGLLIVAGNITLVAVIGTSAPLFKLDSSIGFLLVFISIAALGFDIIICQIYLYILKIGKKVFKNYINWLKTRNIYINAKERKESREEILVEDISNVSEEGTILFDEDYEKRGDSIDE